MNRVEIADGHLAYDDLGSGSPVVLLHDGTLDRRVWRPQLTAFPGYRLLVLDARGHGESATPTQPYQRADDVIALLDHLDLPAAFLIGQSMGGTTALDTALDHPDRVTGVVASGCGTSQQYWRGAFLVDLLRRQFEAARRRDTVEYVELFLRMWVDGPTRRPDEVPAGVRESCRIMAMSTAARHSRPDPVLPGRAADSWQRLPGLTVPLLLLTAELDCPDVHEMAERVVAAVPHAESRRVPGAGHMLNLERPDIFTAAVLGFLDTARVG
ncbi:Hydrolase, alpha/beta hydrolase fold family [Alloactinosynnema sp. L-07]|uniref:alpha/beta fold hydrolase n=1 Tax=Alloactinosynnema sp. L-07 TaxID=1653480 RepID=UPI00065F045D|nr:alpha/beta hydrolase [Alloactinosynnema sp. L-07]CRK61976.1 Hydrolase, alpha/beta hydrolase fold family [Alloactinosynnema sp. L-07]